MARRKTKKRVTSPNYISLILGDTLASKFEDERQSELEKHGIKPSRSAWLKRILCERYKLPLTCVAEK